MDLTLNSADGSLHIGGLLAKDTALAFLERTVAPALKIRVSSSAINFGPVLLSRSDTTTIRVDNIGSSALGLHSISTPSGAGFTLVAPPFAPAVNAAGQRGRGESRLSSGCVGRGERHVDGWKRRSVASCCQDQCAGNRRWLDRRSKRRDPLHHVRQYIARLLVVHSPCRWCHRHHRSPGRAGYRRLDDPALGWDHVRDRLNGSFGGSVPGQRNVRPGCSVHALPRR